MNKKGHPSKNEMKYYGIHACLAIFEKRPQDIIRVYLDESNVKTFKPVLKWCADNKKAYHVVPESDLNKISDSVHHEGVCFLAKELPAVSLDQFLQAVEKEESKACYLYLDGVQNPHNVGSIIRTCAHFGISYIIGQQGKLPSLSPSACRIAKGGAELVRLVAVQKPVQLLEQLKKKGFAFLGTSSHGGTSLYQFSFPSRSIIAMGAESTGLSKDVFALVTGKIQIPGTGLVESLNVSVATSLCIGEYFRQHRS